MESGRVELQLCQLKDLPLLVTLLRTTYIQNYTYLWKDKGIDHMDEEFHPKALKGLLFSANCDFYLIQLDGVSIGIIKLIYYSGLDQYPPDSCAEIHKVYLLEQYKGKGLGKKAFMLLEEIAMRNNISVLWLMVMKSSPAKKFYEKCGYSTHSTSSYEHPMIIPHLKQMYVMIKELNGRS